MVAATIPKDGKSAFTDTNHRAAFDIPTPPVILLFISLAWREIFAFIIPMHASGWRFIPLFL